MTLFPARLTRFHLGAPLWSVAMLSGFFAWRIPELYHFILVRQPNFRDPFAADGMASVAAVLVALMALGAAVTLLGAVAGLFRGAWALRLLRTGYAMIYVMTAGYAVVVMKFIGVIGDHNLTIADMPQDKATLFKLGWSFIWPALALAAFALFGHVLSWRASAEELYGVTHPYEKRRPGDRVIENVRTHGSDPVYRKSWSTSLLTHLLVIVILPWLSQYIGCSERYMVPEGGGEPVVAAIVQVKKPQKQKPKKYILNPNTAISFHVPDLDESDIADQVDEASELTHTADPNRVHGSQFGKGPATGTAGWAEGMGKNPIAFIRLKYSGEGWDDGMDEASRADMNFLDRFNKITKLKVARNPEARTFAELKNFDKGYQPPFIYMTGSRNINFNANDAKILREYLLDGGMLFADAGSPEWSNSFRSFISAVMPDRAIVDIADDDPIYQVPFVFPNGAPPLWHHGGNRALGVKHKGRWCVFFHPGDVNDAWKTGHSGVSKDIADAAYNLGVNIVYYSFTHYLEETKKHRK